MDGIIQTHEALWMGSRGRRRWIWPNERRTVQRSAQGRCGALSLLHLIHHLSDAFIQESCSLYGAA